MGNESFREDSEGIGSPGTPEPQLLQDLRRIGVNARTRMQEGAVTPGYSLERDLVVRVLNDALATEIVCTLRYLGHAYTARGIHSEVAAEEFREHAQEEQDHMHALARRISQLGGTPDFDPRGIDARAHSDYATSSNLEEMIRQNLEAERIAIDIYREMIAWFGNRDPTTRRVLETILGQEETHADEMAALLTTFTKDAST
jgi:bacterioferritin